MIYVIEQGNARGHEYLNCRKYPTFASAVEGLMLYEDDAEALSKVKDPSYERAGVMSEGWECVIAFGTTPARAQQAFVETMMEVIEGTRQWDEDD